MTDLQGAWVTTVFILVIGSVLNAVMQQFALHSALAVGKVHAPEIAGIRVFALWAPTTAVWLGVGIAIGLHGDHGCTSADDSALWLGALYPLTAWPPFALGRHVKVSLPGWYWPVQLSIAVVILLFGGLPCLV